MITPYSLTDITAGITWDSYKSEAQLKTAARLYALSHPTASLAVTIGARTYTIR